MTDKQLSIFLQGLINQLHRVAERQEEQITDGAREMKMVWVGEGEEPLMAGSFRDYEQQPIGEFVAIRILNDFIHELEYAVEMLQGEEV